MPSTSGPECRDPDDVAGPTVNLAAGTHTFTLVVTDNSNAQSQPANVTVTVLPPLVNQNPIAHAGINQTVQIPSGQTTVSVTLDGSASRDPDGGIVQYLWSGSPDPGDFANPAVTLGPGVYTFTLVVKDNGSAESTPANVTITVLAPSQVPIANAGSNQTIQLAQGQKTTPVNLDGSASYDPDGTITRYFWAGMPDPDNVVRPSVTLGPGSYNFTLMVTDNSGEQSPPATVVITVLAPPNQPPVASAGLDQTLVLLSGQNSVSTRLNGTGSTDPDGTIAAYLWSGTPTPEGVVRPTVTLAAGIHPFNLVVTDNQGAASPPSTMTVRVVQARAPVLTVPSLSYSVTQGQSLNIEVSGADPDGDPVTLSATPVVSKASFSATSGAAARGTFAFTPDSSQVGRHVVHFTARDSIGLTDTKIVQITVNKSNQAPALTLPASASVDEGKTLTVKAEATDPNGDPVILSASGLPANAVFIQATGTLTFAPDFTQAGAYSVTITAGDGELTASRTVQITVNDVAGGGGPTELTLQVDPVETPTLLSKARITGTVNAAGAPAPTPKFKSALITGMSPTTGEQGHTLTVTLTGSTAAEFATHFSQNVSRADFGSGISVTAVSVSSPSQAIVTVVIAATATEGPRSVSVTTGSETAVSVLAFNITKGKSVLTGRIIDPDTQQPLTGGTVTIQGTNISAVINPDGTFTLTGVPAGSQVLIVNAPNFEFLALPVTVQSGVTANLGELHSRTTVFNPTAPPSISLLSVAGRNFGDVTGGLNLDDSKRVITDALLLVGGSEAGVMDEYGNQMNPAVVGAGMISLTQEGVRLIAQKMQRGGETVSLGELLFAFSQGFQWTENKPMTLAEWLPLLQTLVNRAWWEPNKAESYLPILMFNRGTNLTPDPPELSPYTRLNPAQAFLFASSLWSYIFRAPEPQGSKSVYLAADFSSRLDVPRPLIQLAQLNPPPQPPSSGPSPFTQFWRNAFSAKTNLLTTNFDSAKTSYLMAVSSMAVPVSLSTLIVSQAVLGTAADNMINALRDIRVASMIPDPPLANSISARVTTDQVGVPNVNVTFRLSTSQINGRDNLSPYIYTLYRFGNGGSDWKVVDRKALEYFTASSNNLTLKDTEPLPLIKYEGQMVRTPSATWFYTITAAKLRRPDLEMSAEDLRNANPWWTLPTQRLLIPTQSLLLTKQTLVSDYSAPVAVTVNASGEVTVDEIAVDPLKGDVYLSDTQGGGTEKQPRFIKISEFEVSNIFAQSGFRFPPGHRGLAIDSAGNLYTDNAASDEQFGGRLFKFYQPDGRRDFVGNINYFSQQLMFARPTSGGPMAIAPGSLPQVSAEDLFVVDELEGMVKRVMVNAAFDPFRRVGQPFANIPIAGKNLDLEVDKTGNAYLLKERIVSTVLTLEMQVSKSYLSTGETFTVTMTVGNPSSWPATGVYPLPLLIEGIGTVRLIKMPESPIVDLAAGETKTFVFEYLAETSGSVRFAGQIQGIDTGGVTISSPLVRSNIDVQITHQDPLEVWIEFPDKDTPLVSVNGKMTVRLSLAASPNLSGNLTNVKFHGNPLTMNLLEKLAISAGSPSPPIPADLMGVPLPMTLKPGEIRSFDYELQGLERGRVELSSYVTAVDPDGKDLSATVRQTVKVNAPVLEVKIAADPEVLKLETDANDKPIPKNMAVKVTIKNIYNQPVENVNLPGTLNLSAVQESFSITGLNCSLAQIQPDPNTTGSIVLGNLQPDESVTRDFTLRADNDGKCDVWTLVASADPDDPQETLNTAGSTRARVTKKILDLDIDFAKTVVFTDQGLNFEDTKKVDIEDTFIVYGTIRNLSTVKTIKIKDILYEVFSDPTHPSVPAVIAAPVLGYEQSLWCDGCGLKPKTVLDPGETLRFESRVTTQNDPAALSRVNLRYEVQGDAYEIIGSQPGPTEAVTSGAVEKSLAVSYAKPPIDPKEVTDRFTYALVESWGNAMTFPGKLVEMFWQTESRNRILASANDKMRLLVKWWLEEPVDKKWELLKKYAIEGVQLPDKLMQQVNQEVEKVGTALGEGDYIYVADKLGQFTGGAIAEVSWEILTCGAGMSVSVAKRGLKEGLEQSMKSLFKMKKVPVREIEERLPGRLLGLTAGEILDNPAAAKMLGVATETIQKINTLAQKHGIIVSGRFRHPRATKLLNEKHAVTGEYMAIPKPEQIKLKTVSDVDVDFLRYQENDLATVVFKKEENIQLWGYDQDYLKNVLKETDPDKLSQKIRSIPNPGGQHPGTGQLLNQGDWDQALLRLEQRVKESRKNFAEIDGWQKQGSTQFKFRYKENGIDRPDELLNYSFRMDDEGRLWVKGPNELTEKRITGDVDLVDICNADGTPVKDPAKRAEIYKELREIAQIQHGESTSWIADPAKRHTFFDAHKPGAEPLTQFGPDGINRVVHIDTKMSYYDELGQYRTTYIGGYEHTKPAGH